MKRVAIITEYCNGNNYGSVLQAYALCKKINDMGYMCEQIPYTCKKTRENLPTSLISKIRRVKNPAHFFYMLKNKMEIREMSTLFFKREQAFEKFRTLIPHNEREYYDDDISECVDDYDVFITGSDQVWNPDFYHWAYYLEFVPSRKVKLSYAASISVRELTNEQRMYFKRCLSDYQAVSVREKSAQTLLCGLTNEVTLVLDPVFLLNHNEWDLIASHRSMPSRYIFTYFLGDDVTQRKLAEQFAKVQGIKLISMPFIEGQKLKCDKHFGDIRLFDVSPEDFISAIRNAEYVFTDSFHAAAFSCIYNKEFFVFPRKNHPGMDERVSSLTHIFGVESRFCNSVGTKSLDYILAQSNLKLKTDVFDKMKKDSMDFLCKNIGGKE